MKRTTLIIVLMLTNLFLFAQNGFNYKALVSDNGTILANHSVDVRFTILENGTTIVYEETQTTTTDASGIFIVNIGEGTVENGDFLTINWANEQYLKVEINTGSGYTDFGTTAFRPVPKAKYADKAGNVFSGDYNALTNTPNFATVATSGDYNDLANIPDFTGWDTDVSDDFDGDFTHLTNIPTGLSDGDDDTHLTDTEIAAMGYIKNADDADHDATNELQNLSLNGTQLNISDGTGVYFSGWDTNASDDVQFINDLSDAKTTNYGVFLGNNTGTNASISGDLVGLGREVMPDATSADYSVGIGNLALKSLTSGQKNVAVGYSAGQNITTGSRNVFIGYGAGANAAAHGVGNIFIGDLAGTLETGSNKLYIENSNSSTPLIGGDFSTNEVTINGSLSIKDGTQGNGRVLVSDANGKASWGSVPQKDKVMILSPVNFEKTYSNSYSYVKGNYDFYYDSGISGDVNMAINLPEGVYLDHITIYYVDNSSNNLTFHLNRTPLSADGGYLSIDSYTTIGNSSSLSFVSLYANVTIAANVSYSLNVYGGPWGGYDTRIVGVKVYYKE